MRFNIKKLEAKGFHINVDKENIDIFSPPVPPAAYQSINSMVEQEFKVIDPALREYVIGSFLVAAQRAQILEAAESYP